MGRPCVVLGRRRAVRKRKVARRRYRPNAEPPVPVELYVTPAAQHDAVVHRVQPVVAGVFGILRLIGENVMGVLELPAQVVTAVGAAPPLAPVRLSFGSGREFQGIGHGSTLSYVRTCAHSFAGQKRRPSKWLHFNNIWRISFVALYY